MLKVWPPVNFETHSNIRPACLPEEDQGNSLAYGGRTGTVSGWGLVDGKTRATQLQAVQVEVLPDKECTNRFSHQICILPKSYMTTYLANISYVLIDDGEKSNTSYEKLLGWVLGGMCKQNPIQIQKDEMVSRSVALKATRIWYVVSK